MDPINLLFTIANTGILFCWLPLLILPRSSWTKTLVEYPYIPLIISFFYLFFLLNDQGLAEADFSSLGGIVTLFQNTSPAGAAAGWMHYLAFDFWVGAWILRDSQNKQIAHLWIVFPLLCTFMLGPVGVLLYALVRFIHDRKK